MSNIGMMDGAFFVGRKDLVDWINGTLEVRIGKVEDTAFGAIACQLLDIMYPGMVAMHKVDWTAKQSFEYVANYKILQAAFIKAGVEKHIDVDRLIKGRYQDNLEFMQWFKRFFEMQVQDKGDYDCEGQRAKGKGGATYIFGANGKGTGKACTPRMSVSRLPASASLASLNSEGAPMMTRSRRLSLGPTLPVIPAPAAQPKARRGSVGVPASAPPLSRLPTRRASLAPAPPAPTFDRAPSAITESPCLSPATVAELTSVRRSSRISQRVSLAPVEEIHLADKKQSPAQSKRASLGAASSAAERGRADGQALAPSSGTKRRRQSLLEVQRQINAVVAQTGLELADTQGSEQEQAARQGRRKSLRVSLLAENAGQNVVWLDI